MTADATAWAAFSPPNIASGMIKMDERYDLEQMRKEIIEDEKLGRPKDKKVSQEEIQKMLLKRQKKETAAT